MRQKQKKSVQNIRNTTKNETIFIKKEVISLV